MNHTINFVNFTVWQETSGTDGPDVSFIPAMARRRMTALEKIAAYLAHQTAPESGDYVTVFASRFGEWNQTVKLIKQYHTDKEMSPAGFSNSVHNAAPGHISLLCHNKNSYTSIAAGQRTLEMGLLEAFNQQQPTLFIYAEEHQPDIFNDIQPDIISAHGVALFINHSENAQIHVSNGTNDCEPLDFEDFCNFLNSGDALSTSYWTLKKK